MDENENGNVNSRNWTFHQYARTPYEEPHHHHNHMPLNLMPSMLETPLSGGGGGGVREPLPVTASTNHHHHHHSVTGISGGPLNPLSCWMGPNSSKYLNNPLSVNPNRPYYLHSYVDVSSEASSPQITLPKNDTSSMISKVEESCEERDNSGGGGGGGGGVAVKKRGGGGGGKAPKEKKPRTNKTPRGAPNEDRAKSPKKMAEVVINGQNMDISKIPIPICSCTGTAHQCYRWGSGGWQSACCTTGLSVHPLPVSTKRRGARIAGRKMSVGAFKKVLEKLSSEGYDFSNPIDLRSYWAKHGTNKFVTIRDGPG
ncbi:hypothetical protein ABFX02_04G118900 [Erythranthe guttata]